MASKFEIECFWRACNKKATPDFPEMPPDPKQYERDKDNVEMDWKGRFQGREHDAMSTYPKYLADDTAVLGDNMWQNSNMSVGDAMVDATQYKASYNSDAQYIFSRVQEHFQTKTKE